MKELWSQLQAQVSACTKCRTKLSNIPVECPPGVLYPSGIVPPVSVKILFVAVAPPKTGVHFYTDRHDGLRRGLFRVLTCLRRPCQTLSDFLNYGYFLVHTAKCAIRNTTSPDIEVSKLCAKTHLKAEIEALLPDTVCWLSKNISYPVCEELASLWDHIDVPFGQVTTVAIGGKQIQFLPTMWPGRGWEKETQAHLSLLLS